MKTEYSNVEKIPLNTVVGATVQALNNKNGTKLTRVTEAGRDDLVIEREGKPTVHIAWVQVKGGFVAGTAPVKPTALPPGLSAEGAAAAEAGDTDVLSGKVLVNDAVRVTKRKKATE